MTDKITSEILLKMSETDRLKALEMLSVIEKRKTQEEAQQNFLKFVDAMWEGFIHGRHFEIMASAFERIAKGELTRLIINMPPRHGKSEMASYLLPAWFLGLYPEKKIMQFSHSSELAETFGRKVRNLVDSDKYHEIFPETKLSKDSTAAARWNTHKGGEYHALGFGTNAAGKGSHLCLGKKSVVQIGQRRGLIAAYHPEDTYIKDVKVGDKIKTFHGWEEVTHHITTTHSSYYVINNDLVASGEHPFKTERGWVQTKDLLLTDKIQSLLGYMEVTTIEQIDKPLDMVDITVEPSHEFLVQCGTNWLRTHNCLIDDPISEQIGKSNNPEPHNTVYDLYMTGARQRLQPGGAIVLVMTRWSVLDLTGRLINNMVKNPNGDQWEVIEFPAIMPSGKPLWPEYWKLEELERTKAELATRFWNAQYMQNPTSEEGAIIKREWWRIWEKKNPPPTEFILMSWDTAYEKHNRADYSAMTVWGVFYHEDEESGVTQPNIMLLDVVKKRVEFPELKQWVYDAYNEWQPDTMMVEKRASGASLIQELRRMGIPVQEFTPGKGNDKISRLTAVADIFASGFVWCPDTRWAQELMDEVAAFPAGMHDDTVDCTSMAMMLFRQGGHIRTRLDEPEEEITTRYRKREYY